MKSSFTPAEKQLAKQIVNMVQQSGQRAAGDAESSTKRHGQKAERPVKDQQEKMTVLRD
jgi:hypothetical protein